MSDLPSSSRQPEPTPPAQTADFGQAQFERLYRILRSGYGLHFDANKNHSLRSSLNERMREVGLPPGAYDVYLDLIEQADLRAIVYGPGTTATLGNVPTPPTAELRALIDQVTVNETSFFRNREHFAALRAEVLPRIIKRHIEAKERSIRLWSAGSAYGQEPYSLAISLIETLEAAGQAPQMWDITIFATDVSSRALRAAIAGRYKREDLRGLSEAQIEKYMRMLPNSQTGPFARPTYEIVPQVRDLVRFAYFNLSQPVYPANKIGNLDLVLCENVTIYMAQDVTRQVIANIYRMLNDGGFLFIGYSETLWQISDQFRLVSSNDTFYYQKPFVNDPKPQQHGRYRPMTGPISTVENRQTPTIGTPPRSIRKPIALPTEPKLPVSAPPVRRLTIPPKPTPRLKNSADVVRQARQRILGGDFDAAKEMLDQVLASEPRNTDALCAMARRAHALANVTDAIRYCTEAIAANPLSEEAHVLLGMIYREQNDTPAAIAAFQKAIYINIDSIIAHLYLGQIYEKLGDRALALREYRSALTAVYNHPNNDVIEEWPVELLRATCEKNIRRLSGPMTRPYR